MSLDLFSEYLYENAMDKRSQNSATWQRVVGIYVLAFFLVAFSFHSGKSKLRTQHKKAHQTLNTK